MWEELHEYRESQTPQLGNTFTSLTPSPHGKAKLPTCAEGLSPHGKPETEVTAEFQCPSEGDR